MKKLGLGSIALVALALSAGCASSDADAPVAKPSDPDAVGAAQLPNLGKLGGRFKGTFGAGQGMRFERLPMSGGAGASEQAFKLDGASKFTFTTLSNSGGFYCSGANNCADCTSGTCGALGSAHPLFSDCGSGGAQTCGQVNVDPGAGTYDDVWVVIKDITTTAGSVSFSRNDTPSATYNPPLSGTTYYKYGTLDAASGNKRMDMTYGGGFDPATDTAVFNVEVYYSARYTAYSVAGPAVSTPPDACSGGTTLLDNSSGEEITVLFDLPFPFTIYQLNPSNAAVAANRDKGWVSDNGIFGIGSTGASATSNALPSTKFGVNTALGAVFWDDINLAYTTSKVCMKTLGMSPSRQMVLRWNDVDINGAGSKVSFSAVVYEGSDVLEFYYEEPTVGGITNNTRGATATTGVQGTNALGVTRVAQKMVPEDTTFLPATGGSGNYPVRYTLTPN